MSVFDEEFKSVLNRFLNNKSLTARFLQYNHKSVCQRPCADCPERHKRVYENGKHVKLPAHPHCDCYYKNVETKPLGSISNKQPAPDVWLKMFGKLPDYYITKQEAVKTYGWEKGKNTLAGKAPGKMIGGDVFYNDPPILPQEKGRIWKECDIDYIGGKRGPARLYYSNDGLIFYSPDHLSNDVTIYFIQ